jgi:hypothetical protein
MDFVRLSYNCHPGVAALGGGTYGVQARRELTAGGPFCYRIVVFVSVHASNSERRLSYQFGTLNLRAWDASSNLRSSAAAPATRG